MKRLFWLLLIISFISSSAFGQGLNKIVFGPLEGDEAGVLTVHNGEDIEIEMWVRTDPNNPGPVDNIFHALLSEDIIIAERNGIVIEPPYDNANWGGFVGVDGPYVHNPNDNYPIPEGYTCEIQYALHCDPFPCDTDEMDTQGEWDLYGTWMMVVNMDIPVDQTYFPFMEGWYPGTGNGTEWSFDGGGGVTPEQSYCGLYFPMPQTNKIVFGPLVGDEAGVLTVHNNQAIGVELWVRTDPDNPAVVTGVQHGLLSEDIIILERNGMDIEPQYESNYWQTFVDGPYSYDDPYEYEFPIPPGWTCEMQWALRCDLPPCDGEPMDTQGEWDLYGTWLMITNIEIPTEETYFPFQEGWYPHSGEGTHWSFEGGGGVYPEEDYCGLYFEQYICEYIPGDCDHNGFPIELTDVLAMIGFYRGTMRPDLCECGDDPLMLYFAATADPNGNCAPNELLDVVTEIAAYRGTMTASGCPDCPGSEGLVIRENKGH